MHDLEAKAKRILDRFSGQMADYVSGVIEEPAGFIDDGANYDDPLRDTRPDFIKKDNAGWESLVILKR